MSNVLRPKILAFGFWISFVIWILAFGIADAAEFRLESDNTTFGVGDKFLVQVTVDTEGEAINAFEGEVVFPEELLELKGIREKGSIVNLWVTEPPVFSGLTPGGYRGEGVLFLLIFEAKAEGAGSIDIEQGRALLHDGKGSPAELEIFNSQFSIGPPTGQTPEMIRIDDREPPEPFELRVAQDPNVFEGQRFLVFAAQDKNSGISHYEVSFMRSGRRTEWQRVSSPLALARYEEIETIWVKAVDRVGNERIVGLAVKNSFLRFLLWGNIGILGGIGGIFGLWLWRKKISKLK